MKLSLLIQGALGAAIAGLALTVALGAVPACGTTIVQPPAQPDPCKMQVVDLAVIASPRINLEENGEPRPVQLRLYQLSTDIRFNNASFQDIWKNDKATLADELVKVTELTVYPDSRTDIKFQRDESAMFIAAVALFRNPKGRSWYTMLELPPPPGKGACSAACPTGDCGDAGKQPQVALKFAIWVDGSRVDEGSDHLEDYPTSGRHREVSPPFSSPADGDPPAAGGKGGKSSK
jgi:type VI secretion system protein VasD